MKISDIANDLNRSTATIYRCVKAIEGLLNQKLGKSSSKNGAVIYSSEEYLLIADYIKDKEAFIAAHTSSITTVSDSEENSEMVMSPEQQDSADLIAALPPDHQMDEVVAAEKIEQAKMEGALKALQEFGEQQAGKNSYLQVKSALESTSAAARLQESLSDSDALAKKLELARIRLNQSIPSQAKDAVSVPKGTSFNLDAMVSSLTATMKGEAAKAGEGGDAVKR